MVNHTWTTLKDPDAEFANKGFPGPSALLRDDCGKMTILENTQHHQCCGQRHHADQQTRMIESKHIPGSDPKPRAPPDGLLAPATSQ